MHKLTRGFSENYGGWFSFSVSLWFRGAQPGQPVFNVAGTRVGIQVIPANSTGPRVVVPTNAGAQALARQRVVARPLVYPDRQGAASVATTDGPSSQVRDPYSLIRC